MIKIGHIRSSNSHNFFKETVAIGCLFLVLLIVFFYDIVFLGKTLRVSNTIATTFPTGHFNYPGGLPKYMAVYDNTPAVLEEPYQKFKERSLSENIFPLWNPHQAGGYPFLATLESSLFFLPEIILYLLPPPIDWDFYLLFRLFMAGLFTYCFMRVLGFSLIPSITAGVSYMFSGPILSFMTNVTLNADILIPLFLLLIEMLLRRNSKIYAVLLSFVIFQAVAGGHPEHTFFLFLTGLIYFAFRIITKAYSYDLRNVATNFAVSFACGIGLSSVQLIPFAEYVFFNSWHVHAGNVGIGHASLEKAITIIFPWYYSTELVSYKGWTYNTWQGGWIGFLPIWLAVFTIFAKNKNRISYIFLSLAGLYLLKTYGFVLVNWIGYLPIFSLIKFPLHITQNIAFGVSVLCGIAISYLFAEPQNLKRFFLSFIPIVLIATIALVVYPPSNRPLEIFGLSVAILAILLVVVVMYANSLINHRVVTCVIVILLFSELFCLIPRERIPRAKAFQAPPYITFLKKDSMPFRVYGISGCLFPNTATAFGLDDIGVYEALFVKRFTDYIRELVDSSFFNERSFHAFRGHIRDPANKFLDLLNVKYLILPKNILIPPEHESRLSLKVVYKDEVTIYERLNALPRIMIRHRADVVADSKQALRYLKNNYDICNRVLLDSLPSGVSLAPDLPVHDSSSVRIIDYGINSKIFAVNMEHDGFLIVNDVNYPGWRVRVDGKVKELLSANYLFQSVFVPAGKHLVEFEFRPPSFLIGLLISVLTLVFIVLWILSDQIKRFLKK